MRRRLPLAISGCVAVAAVLVAATASAQPVEPTWRQRARTQSSSLSRFTFEARFGAYYPEVDEEFGGPGPYAEYFGTGAQFYFGLEIDWTPIRIPYVGRLGPAFGWGFITMNGAAQIEGATPVDPDAEEQDTSTGPKTSLTIHAMHTSAVLRIDEIARRTVIPVVPYAKFGFGFGYWTSGTDTGTTKIGTDCKSVAPTDCIVGEGLSLGPHLGLGGMLGLNWLDPRSGSMGRESAGIQQAYLFGEWMWTNLDSGAGKPAMHVGTSTWVVGLAVDL